MSIFPVTALVGARQTGKSTLAKMIAKSFRKEGDVHYFDLELIADLKILEQPQQVLENLKGLIIIDEVQRRPDLFPLLRVLSDRRPLPARFLVLGSASGELLKQTSESLAGRIGYIELPGFSIVEIDFKAYRKLWVQGGFPESFLAPTEKVSFLWRQQFIRTFLERDIPSFGIKIEPMQLWRFWQMAAHYHGQIWNHSEIARSLQVSDKTVKGYLDVLTHTFMVRQLAPWYNNTGKRIVKSPKFFIRDSGLLHALLNLTSLEEVQRHPKLGASWEGFALEQVIELSGQAQNVFFWATQGLAEMDLVMNMHGKLWGFEIKYADAPSATKSMRLAMESLKLDKVYVVYPGDKGYLLEENIQVVPLKEAPSLFF